MARIATFLAKKFNRKNNFGHGRVLGGAIAPTAPVSGGRAVASIVKLLIKR